MVDKHIVKAFDSDLEDIKNHINTISGLVESQLSYSYQSLKERDEIPLGLKFLKVIDQQSNFPFGQSYRQIRFDLYFYCQMHYLTNFRQPNKFLSKRDQ